MKTSMKRKMLGLLGGVIALAGAIGFSTAEATPVVDKSDETVTVEKVTFDNDGVKMVGNLYKPRRIMARAVARRALPRCRPTA